MKNGAIEIKQNSVYITPVSGTVWLSQYQIADLFETTVSSVGSNIRSIFKSDVLRDDKVSRTRNTDNGGLLIVYNLELITALAFRIRTRNTEIFRNWLLRRAISSISVSITQIPLCDPILN